MKGFSYQIKTSGISVANAPFFRISTALLDTGNTCLSIPDDFESEILAQFDNDDNNCAFDNE